MCIGRSYQIIKIPASGPLLCYTGYKVTKSFDNSILRQTGRLQLLVPRRRQLNVAHNASSGKKICAEFQNLENCFRSCQPHHYHEAFKSHLTTGKTKVIKWQENLANCFRSCQPDQYHQFENLANCFRSCRPDQYQF
jgi:hypothetical protein